MLHFYEHWNINDQLKVEKILYLAMTNYIVERKAKVDYTLIFVSLQNNGI